MDSNYLSSNHFIKYNAVGTSWVWSLGREDPLGEGNGHSLQYSCLENPKDRGACWGIYSPYGHKESDITEQLTLSLHFQGPPWQSNCYDSSCLLAKEQNIKQKQYCNKFNKDKKIKICYIYRLYFLWIKHWRLLDIQPFTDIFQGIFVMFFKFNGKLWTFILRFDSGGWWDVGLNGVQEWRESKWDFCDKIVQYNHELFWFQPIFFLLYYKPTLYLKTPYFFIE